MQISALLDEVKTKHGIASDYKLAFFLEVVPGAVKHWRHARATPDERACQRIAKALGKDPDALTAQVQAMRAPNDDARAIWQRIALRLAQTTSMATTICAICFIALMSMNPQTVAAFEANNNTSLYIMLNRDVSKVSRWTNRAARWLCKVIRRMAAFEPLNQWRTPCQYA